MVVKDYLVDSINWHLIVSVPVYYICIVVLLLLICKHLFVVDRSVFLFCIVTPAMLFFLLFLDCIIKIIPLFTDYSIYQNILRSVYNSHYRLAGDPNKYVGFRLHAFLPYLLSFDNMFHYIMMNSIFNLVGFMLIWKAWSVYKGGLITKIEQRIFLFLASCYPVGVVFSLVPLRESYCLFSFALFLYGFFKGGFSLILLTGAILTLLLRRQYIIFLMLLYLIRLLFNSNYRICKIRTILVFLIFPLAFHTINLLAIKYLKIGITPQNISVLRTHHFNAMKEASGGVYPAVMWENWFDIISSFPEVFLQFVLAPFPVLRMFAFWKSLAYMLDGVFIAIIVSILIIGLRRIRKNLFWSLVSFMFLVINAYYEFMITGAVRHRYLSIVMLFPVVAEILAPLFSRETIDPIDKKSSFRW